MEVTRKGFISSVATALVAVAASAPTEAFASFLAPSAVTGPESFSSLIGSTFSFSGPGGITGSLVLRSVVKRSSDWRTEQFSLLFATKDGSVCPEGKYQVSHPTLGSMELFLVPGGRKAALRADFSLLK
jgi:hypothetical protein